MSTDNLILLELNELNFDYIEWYSNKGLLPNFKNVFENFKIVETQSEEKYELLEPWIQWATVHTGKTFDDAIIKTKKGNKYLPNKMARYCTTELKTMPILYWMYEILLIEFLFAQTILTTIIIIKSYILHKNFSFKVKKIVKKK